MYYCSIEDAWGNNFNKPYFNYNSNLITFPGSSSFILEHSDNTHSTGAWGFTVALHSPSVKYIRLV